MTQSEERSGRSTRPDEGNEVSEVCQDGLPSRLEAPTEVPDVKPARGAAAMIAAGASSSEEEDKPSYEAGPLTVKKVATLAAAVLAVVAVSWAFKVLATVAVVAAVLLMIVLHEFGHYLMAKRAGMKVTEFFVGMGPRLWSFQKGETEYGVRAFPVGGYCKIIGMSNLEHVAPPDEPRTYRQKGFWSRISVAVAGSAMHMLLAFVLLYAIFVGTGLPEPSTSIGTMSTITGQQSPAQRAGLQVGDVVESIDGTPLTKWDALPPYIQAHPNQTIQFGIRRGSQRLTVPVTPLDLSTLPASPDRPAVKGGKPTGFVGIGPGTHSVRTGPLTGLVRSGQTMGRAVGGTFNALGQIFSPKGITGYFKLLGGQPAAPQEEANRFLSPVGLVHVAGQTAERGLADALQLLVMINVFVGIFNMIPLLPFDGGHVVIAVYEAIRSRIKGRRHFADVSKMMPVAYVTVAVLAFIGLSALYLDLVRPLKL